jgi:hypothetical protein
MRPSDIGTSSKLDVRLAQFANDVHPLPGLLPAHHRAVLIAQFVDSIRRIKFIEAIKARKKDLRRADPANDIFDPLRAAIIFQAAEFDEACWLVFLATHFGKHRIDGWRLTRDIYGGLAGNTRWTWAQTSPNPAAFIGWLDLNQVRLKADGISRRFSSHRKYESLSPKFTGKTVASYVEWVGPERKHKIVFDQALKDAAGDPHAAFDILYHSLDRVSRFGRLAKFDYLTMIAKLGLAPIQPGSTYMQGATGPFDGAKLLFGVGVAANRGSLDAQLVELADYIDISMQVMEDALCNWQKSPGLYIQFRG